MITTRKIEIFWGTQKGMIRYSERCSPDTCSPATVAPRIDAGVGASLSEGEGVDVDGDVGVGEGEA